ncbi:MAG TPA: ABC transporter ATP-binding protein, partial [Paludibacteraceae bacterium]|nr:ABC transporter ATP-binding protein [Paludibacteraceae bacterium]
YLPEDVGFYDNRTGLYNLLYTAMLNRIPENEARNKALELFQLVGLEGVENKKTGQYSRGMRQRLGLADVLIKNPEMIILDEPTSGIDPQGVKSFLDLILQLRNEQGLTILFSSHNLHQVEQVCDAVGIFSKGKIIASGNIPDLSRQVFNDETHSLEDVYNQFFEGGNQDE